MKTEFTLTQKRALAVATVIAILFGAYFLRSYFILIVVAAVVAYLFSPLYNRLNKRMGTGLSATLTLLAVFASVIVPVGLIGLLAVVQITEMVKSVADWVERTDLSTLGDKTLTFVNELLARVPFADVTVTPEMIRKAMTTVAQNAGEWLLHMLQGAAGGVVGGITAAILFLYVFISLLTNKDAVQRLIRQLNPLGEEVTDLYLAKMGAMVSGTVKGQFIIAVCQGIAGAISIYIAGFHDGFFIFADRLERAVGHPAGQRHHHDSVRHRNDAVRQRLRRHVRRRVPPHRGDQHRQLPAPDPGAAGGPPRLGADAAVGVRRHRDVRRVRHRHRPGADDRHRHDDQRLPRGVQGRAAGTTMTTTTSREVQEAQAVLRLADAQGQAGRCRSAPPSPTDAEPQKPPEPGTADR